MLVKVSNDNNLALRSVAENLASTGTEIVPHSVELRWRSW
jgi:hypothetical protein